MNNEKEDISWRFVILLMIIGCLTLSIVYIIAGCPEGTIMLDMTAKRG